MDLKNLMGSGFIPKNCLHYSHSLHESWDTPAVVLLPQPMAHGKTPAEQPRKSVAPPPKGPSKRHSRAIDMEQTIWMM